MSNVGVQVGQSEPVQIWTGGGSDVVISPVPPARIGISTAPGAGPPGPAGPSGEAGVPGPPGASGGFYVYEQGTPAAVWTIPHTLPYNPNITVVDSAGSVVEGDIDYQAGQVVLAFSGAFSGTAYLS